MRLSSPLEHLSASLHHAALVALPELGYPNRDWEAMRALPAAEQKAIRAGERPYPELVVRRRPEPQECTVLAMFPQTWGSTALGFGGVGGAAMTDAYTIVIEGPGRDCAVYWSGRHAYTVSLAQASEQQRRAWQEDLQARTTADCANAAERYGATAKVPRLRTSRAAE